MSVISRRGVPCSCAFPAGRPRAGSRLLDEFAHQLDMMYGRIVDGRPLLESNQQLERWISAVEPAYELVEDCESVSLLP